MRGIDVKKKIIESGVTLKEVSDKMNVSPQALQNILKTSDMKIGVLARIAEAINKNIYFFLKEYEQKYANTNQPTTFTGDQNVNEFLDVIAKQQNCINELSNTIRINSEIISDFIKKNQSE